jgi:predicted acylesterase/phospholipase RssA
MDFHSILASGVEYHPLATDAATGKSTDLRPMISNPAELRLAIRASAALPFLAGPPVRLRGRRYYDAGVAESIPFRTPLAQGATHILVLRSRRALDVTDAPAATDGEAGIDGWAGADALAAIGGLAGIGGRTAVSDEAGIDGRTESDGRAGTGSARSAAASAALRALRRARQLRRLRQLGRPRPQRPPRSVLLLTRKPWPTPKPKARHSPSSRPRRPRRSAASPPTPSCWRAHSNRAARPSTRSSAANAVVTG